MDWQPSDWQEWTPHAVRVVLTCQIGHFRVHLSGQTCSASKGLTPRIAGHNLLKQCQTSSGQQLGVIIFFISLRNQVTVMLSDSAMALVASVMFEMGAISRGTYL